MIGQIDPALLVFFCSLQNFLAIVVHIAQRAKNQIALELGKKNRIVELAVRAVDPEKVRKATGHHTEIACKTFLPTAFQRLRVTTANIYAIHRPCHHIKTGGENDDIKLNFLVANNDPVFGETFDRLFIQINQIDIVAVKLLKEVRLR